MAKILIKITNGPENTKKTAIAFILDKSTIDYDHDFSIFLAGYAIQSY